MSHSRSDDGLEDFDQILAGASNSQLCDPRSFELLQDVNAESRPPALLASSDLNPMLDLSQGLDFSGTITHTQSSSQDEAPRQLLSREFTDQDDLLKILPRAQLKNNCIGVFEYIVVVRLLLFQWTVSNCDDNNWLSSGVLANPHSYARILRRLGAELKLVCSDDGCDSRYLSDSRRLFTCLGDLEKDMVKAYTVMGSKDGVVQIFTETEPYKDCLLSIVKFLENCKG